MTDREHERSLKPVPGAVYGLAGATAAALILGSAAFVTPRPAGALPAYAQQTGLACGRCHVNPAGGGTRTSFGKAFAANGYKVPSSAGKPAAETKPGDEKSAGDEKSTGDEQSAGGEAAPPGPVASPPPSIGYYGSWPIILDRAQAQALSLRYPYYSHFNYDYCDYDNKEPRWVLNKEDY